LAKIANRVASFAKSNGENRPSIGQIRQPIPDSKPDINTDAAVGSPLSEEQQKCFEWAKTEKYGQVGFTQRKPF